MFDLKGNVALVTGASGGIGSQIAKLFHAKGAKLALCGRQEDKLKAIAAAMGDDAALYVLDLADRQAVKEIVPRIETDLGPIDILVNNAGHTRDGLSVRMGDADWDSVIDIDLSAAFRLSRAVLRGMMKRRYGRIINMASVVGITGNPGQANYCASKAGLIGLTKSLAREVANRNITVNAVAPGYIETAMTAALDEAQRGMILGSIPAGRVGNPADIAAGCLYLASQEAAYLTGQTLHINGGMAMV